METIVETDEDTEGADVDQKPGTRSIKQVILQELDVINDRLSVNIEQWEKRYRTYNVTVEDNTAGRCYPQGFGLYLMREKCPPPIVGSAIETVYQVLLNLTDVEVQDGLLSFLDEFIALRKIVERTKHEREELLSSVAEWMETDTAGVRKVRSVHLGVAVAAENDLRTCYDETRSHIERLFILKKQLLLLDKTWAKRKVSKNESEFEVSIDSEEKAGMLPAASGNELINDIDIFSLEPAAGPAVELVKVVQNTKDRNNEDKMNILENKLEEVIKMIVSGEQEIKTAWEILSKNRDDYKKLQTEHVEAKEELEHLMTRVKELESQQEKTPAKGKVTESPGAISENRARGLSRKVQVTQTDIAAIHDVSKLQAAMSTQFEDQPPPPGKESVTEQAKAARGRQGADTSTQSVKHSPTKDAHPVPPKPEKRETVAKEPEKISSMEHLQVVARGQIQKKPTLSPKDAEETPVTGTTTSGASRQKKSSTLQTPSVSMGSADSSEDFRQRMGRPSLRLLEVAADTAKEAATASPRMSLKRRKSSGQRPSMEHSQDWLKGELEPDDEPKDSLTMEQLHVLLKQHVTNIANHATTLLQEFMALRKNARDEISNIKNKETRFIGLEAQIKMCLKMAVEQTDRLPVIETINNGTQMRAINRWPESHLCQFCLCHETTPSSVLLSDQKYQMSLTKTLEMCIQYSKILDTMKATYLETRDILISGQRTLEKIMADLVWGELGTADYSNLDSDVDDEIIEAVENIRRMPKETPRLLEHAIKVTDTMDNLIKTDDLCLLEKAINDVRSKMDDTALRLSRLRANKDFLRTGRILDMCMCPFCKCYDSPLRDDSRLVTEDKRAAKQQIIKRSLALLQQTMGSVIRSVDSGTKRAVSAVSPQLVDLVDEARNKLYEALNIIADEDGL